MSLNYKILTKDEITFFKQNKQHITFDLLEALRKHGNDGKQIALEILDIFKDNEGYYLDAFENRVSCNGMITIKRPNTKFNLFPIHYEEIERCSKDIFYFMENYCKIVTPKGVKYSDLRPYQKTFLIDMISEEAVCSLQSRQSGKSVVASIYLLWEALFREDILIGIAANRSAQAVEILDKVRKIFLNLPIWLMQGIIAFNKTYIEFENGVKILTDTCSGDSFRGYTVSILFLDEVAHIKPSTWHEFADSVFPAQGALAWKKTILTSTMKGLNHWYEIVEGAKKNLNGYKFHQAFWYDVPRYDKSGNILTNDEFQRQVIAKHGEVYWQQNYENNAMGSSHTLINAEKLKEFNSIEPILTISPGLKIYKKPQEGHKYIISVDPSKDGKDAFAINILDITDLKFEQVAAGQLQVDYLLMPDFLVEWGEWYNFAFIIIENNEGSGTSIGDTLWKVHEYENMYFDIKTESNSTNKTKLRKKYPGFRTTTKSRKLILSTMKSFIENGNLLIYDKGTINEFFTFILINGKYQADDSCHDDAIMALAIAFAPFCSTKNFNDIKLLVDVLYKRIDYNENSKVDLSEVFAIGGFDDGTAENANFLTNRNNTFGDFYGSGGVFENDISPFG